MNEMQAIRIKFLDRATTGLRWVGKPSRGWLRAVRQALGITQVEMAKRLGVAPSMIRTYEDAEQKDSASIATLRRAAAALECELVFAIIPQKGRTFSQLAADRNPEAAHRRAVAHSMALSGRPLPEPEIDANTNTMAAAAVQALLNGFRLDPSSQLRVLRKIAEKSVKTYPNR